MRRVISAVWRYPWVRWVRSDPRLRAAPRVFTVRNANARQVFIGPLWLSWPMPYCREFLECTARSAPWLLPKKSGIRAALGLSVLVALLTATIAEAQVINPTRVEFTVSADHNVTVLGQAAVTRYDLRVFLPGATAPVTTADLAKPTAVDGATVSVDRQAVFVALPLGEYVARVAAVGPGGEGVSEATAPFGRLSAPAAPANAGVAR